MHEHIAQWNPLRQLWEAPALSLFSEQREPFWETWPTSGSMRSGQLSRPHASGRRTDASACSSSRGLLLPTPNAALADGGQSSRSGTRKGEALLGNLGDLLATPRATRGGSSTENAKKLLLPTPSAVDGDGGGRLNSQGHQSTLPGTVRELDPLLPTPVVTDANGARNNTRGGDRTNSNAGDTLGDVIYRGALLPTPGTLDHVEKRTTHAGGNPTLQGATCGLNPVDVERQRAQGRGERVDEALLPTPLAGEARHGSPNQAHGRGDAMLTGVILGLDGEEEDDGEALFLLPTPRQRDYKGGTASRGGDNKHDLPSALLPTPEAKNAHAGPDYARMERDGSGGHDLVTAVAYDGVEASKWGRYEPAIRQWEAVTRPAPPPTEPNTKGNPRLHAPFAEWLMGWAAGWCTDPELGLKRPEQLRIIGNGVVPQQALAAILHLATAVDTAPIRR